MKYTYTQSLSMPLLMPSPLDGRGPTLSTLHEVETILRTAESALSMNELKRRMKAKAVPHATMRTVVDEFKRLGLASEGSKGVLWTLQTDDVAWKRGRHERLA